MKIPESYLRAVLFVIVAIYAVIGLPWYYRYRFEDHNLGIMNELSEPLILDAIRNNMPKIYNFTELFEWEHTYLKWVDIGELHNRTTDPCKILASGKGHCGEFALVYLAACLSLGYEARWLVSVKPYNYLGLHNWVEVKVDDTWIHVDPTERIWNEPSMYKDRNWWGLIGRDVFVYAFEQGTYEDVTYRYR